jgi:uncharacterized protein YciI
MFLLLPTYTAPLDEVDRVLQAHHEWLAAQYAAGRFLLAGPRDRREGGFILSTGDEHAEIQKLVATDPFTRAGVATYQVFHVTVSGGAPEVLKALAEHGVDVP